MTRVELPELEVGQVTLEELSVFRVWFAEHDWQVRDRQVAEKGINCELM